MSEEREIESGALQVLLDKQEIHEVLMRYCRGIDRRDLDLVLSVFHEDAHDNHTGKSELAHERFPKVLAVAEANVKRTSHTICNELVEVHGDVAASESYLVAYHRLEHDGRELDWILGARYVDRLERRSGVWRIAHRTVICDWERFDPVDDPPTDHNVAGWFTKAHKGVPGPQDFSYQVFATAATNGARRRHQG